MRKRFSDPQYHCSSAHCKRKIIIPSFSIQCHFPYTDPSANVERLRLSALPPLLYCLPFHQPTYIRLPHKLIVLAIRCPPQSKRHICPKERCNYITLLHKARS